MIDIDRERSKHALIEIKALVKLASQDGIQLDDTVKTVYGNYVSFAKALPVTILQIGLGQTLASKLAASGGSDPNKKRNPTEQGHYVLYDHLTKWLGRDSTLAPFANCYTGPACVEILTKITECEQRAYIYAQQEAIAYSIWLKKLSVAMLVQPEGGA